VVLQLYLDDVVRLRKPHACGGFEWTVVRLGADIGLRCQKCSHRVMLSRSDLERRFHRFIRRGALADAPMDLDLDVPSSDVHA
jgi:hypothetical protein